MMMRSRMVSVEVDVALEEFSDVDLIDELEMRGYMVVGETDDPLFKIRQSYLLDSPENFRKFIENYLRLQGMPV
jgi:hypothetical protein